MRIEGSFVVAARRERVWAAITDPRLVGPCIPGCESIEVLGPTLYRAAVKVELGPIKARFNLQVEVTSETPPERVLSTTRGEEGSRASTVSAENELRLAVLGAHETEVAYVSEVSVVGRLGRFGLGVMKKKAEALGRAFADAFRERVEAAVAADA